MPLFDSYYAYWGKAKPADSGDERFHLLPYHSLDVAACGHALLTLPRFSLAPLAGALGWTRQQVDALFVFFLSLHDLGKFSRSFQGLAPGLSDALVSPGHRPYDVRHDTLGWWLWVDYLVSSLAQVELSFNQGEAFWAAWIRSVTGHHGMPPQERTLGGVTQQDSRFYFLDEDRQAALDFARASAKLLLPADIPRPRGGQAAIFKQFTWRLAGLSVLADWLGSNQTHFPYCGSPMPLDIYWHERAMPRAEAAMAAAGLAQPALRTYDDPLELFDHLQEPTPLQKHAASVALQQGPQLFLLEDVTGAGKTEAALILAHRLMQAGHAHGLYFALPSMATANQMYQRVGRVYRRFYTSEARPSLILSHGVRQLVEEFRDSILHPGTQPQDLPYRAGEATASTQCNAWLADNRKKALLAEIGVGTLDQALLAVLPARHQSLRLLGLSNKILLIDEVHAYDRYMTTLLKTLLTAHARQGGSAILLSATLPLQIRDDLIDAYRYGLGDDDIPVLEDQRYPLAVQVGSTILSHACATRPQVRRSVAIDWVSSEEEALRLMVAHARAGRCVAWIRNTVEDARRAANLLRQALPEGNVALFHSRFAMGDRLDIENQVLARFGKESTGAQRRGKVLIGTQVLEQSLDFCVDAMISDLAPIDLLIQRVGRLHRHARTLEGELDPDGVERRPPAVLHVLGPLPDDEPAGTWYSVFFPKGCFVYPDIGKLWLGARALLRAGRIITPGEADDPGGVRNLVEAVYGPDAETIPPSLQRATAEQLGKDYAYENQAKFNRLDLNAGYCADSSRHWFEDDQVPTRLGDTSLTVYLACEINGELQPLRSDTGYAWENSALRIDQRHATALSPSWAQRFEPALHALRAQHRLLAEPAFILPLIEIDDRWQGKVWDSKQEEQVFSYDALDGLTWG